MRRYIIAALLVMLVGGLVLLAGCPQSEEPEAAAPTRQATTPSAVPAQALSPPRPAAQATVPSDPQAPTVRAQEPTGPTVYITRTGVKYHRGSCRYLRQSKSAVSLSDARSRGYTPCKVCKPPG